jgi:hypothetical protein
MFRYGRATVAGSPVCLYGNAAGLGEVFATKARLGGMATQARLSTTLQNG